MVSIRNSLDTAVYNTVYETLSPLVSGAGFQHTVPESTVQEIIHLSFEFAINAAGADRHFYIKLYNGSFDEIIAFAHEKVEAADSGFMIFSPGLPNWSQESPLIIQNGFPVGLRAYAGAIWTLGTTNSNAADAIANVRLYSKQWIYPS